MSVRIDFTYDGGLRCSATHAPSQTVLLTDAPVDNQGKGESFSPTDLVATALGTCILTTMAIYAERHSIDLRGATAKVEKEMIATPSRRIGKLTAEIRLPLPGSHPQRDALERAGLTCPVHQSLHPDMEKKVTFEWLG
jgi:putative redox protein